MALDQIAETGTKTYFCVNCKKQYSEIAIVCANPECKSTMFQKIKQKAFYPCEDSLELI